MKTKTPEQQLKEWEVDHKRIQKLKLNLTQAQWMSSELRINNFILHGKAVGAKTILKLERARVEKVIDEITTNLWDSVYQEEIEVDDCLEVLNIYVTELKAKLKEQL